MIDNKKLEMDRFEGEVVRQLITNRVFFSTFFESLKLEYFNNTDASNVFTVVSNYFNTEKDIPTKAILEAECQRLKCKTIGVEGLIEYCFAPESNFSEDEITYLKKRTFEFIKKEKFKTKLLEAYETIEGGDELNWEEVSQSFRDIFKKSLDDTTASFWSNYKKRFEEARNEREKRVPTGYPTLDSVLNGGWANGDLYSFLGLPGFGKSVFLCNVAHQAMIQGYNVLYITLEMSEKSLHFRIDSIYSKIPSEKIIKGSQSIEKVFGDMVDNHPDKMGEIAVAYLNTRSTVMDIEAKIDKLKFYNEFTPNILIVDYGDILKSSRPSKSAYEEQAFVFQELKDLAIILDIPIITATQATRNASNSKGGTTDIVGMDQVADSIGKVRILDCLLSICQSAQDKKEGKIKLYIAKNRHGAASKILPFNICYDNFAISDDPSMDISQKMWEGIVEDAFNSIEEVV